MPVLITHLLSQGPPAPPTPLSPAPPHSLLPQSTPSTSSTQPSTSPRVPAGPPPFLCGPCEKPPSHFCCPHPYTLHEAATGPPQGTQTTSNHLLLKTLHASHRPEDRTWTHPWDLCKTPNSDPSTWRSPSPMIWTIWRDYYLHILWKNTTDLIVGPSLFSFQILFSVLRALGLLFPRLMTCQAL